MRDATKNFTSCEKHTAFLANEWRAHSAMAHLKLLARGRKIEAALCHCLRLRLWLWRLLATTLLLLLVRRASHRSGVAGSQRKRDGTEHATNVVRTRNNKALTLRYYVCDYITRYNKSAPRCGVFARQLS